MFEKLDYLKTTGYPVYSDRISRLLVRFQTPIP